MSIRDTLTGNHLVLTRSEEMIVQVLLSDYPMSGLGTATSLARRAGVSGPTVMRLAVKLGFDGFPDFQEKLLADVEARLHSPLLMMEAKRHDVPIDSVGTAYLRSVVHCLQKAVSAAPAQNYDRAAKLVMAAKGQVMLLGGRFSRHVAGMLAGYLSQFRSGVRDLGMLAAEQFDTLVDLDKRDVLIVFDYRRYQLGTIDYARQAAERGVRIVLFTDPWLSPIAEHAEVTIIGSSEVASPYDTLAPAVGQIEALIAQLVAVKGDETRGRIEALETMRHANAVTLDDLTDAPEAFVTAGRRSGSKRRRGRKGAPVNHES